jgi:hypothetical protein
MIPMNHLEEFQQRVLNEKQELDGRIERLGKFLSSSKVDVVEDIERYDLQEQYYIMRDYSAVLARRIKRWT